LMRTEDGQRVRPWLYRIRGTSADAHRFV
jgi:hypothetical protein